MLHRRRRTLPSSTQTTSAVDTTRAGATSGRGVSEGASDSKTLRHPTARLGQILVEEEVITSGQLEEALEHKRRYGGFLGQALMNLKIVDQATLTTFLVKQCKIPHLSLADYQIDPAMASVAPKELCEKYGFLPIDKMGKILTLAMVDPLDKEAMDAMSEAVPELRIKAIHCDWDDFERAFFELFPDAKPKPEVGEASMEDFGLASAPAEPKKSTETKPAESAPAPPKTQFGAKPEEPKPAPATEPSAVAKPRTGPARSGTAAAVDAGKLDTLLERVTTLVERLEADHLERRPRSVVVSVESHAENEENLPAHFVLDAFVEDEGADNAKLAEHFGADAAADGECLIISGAPGAGKTHLAVAAARAFTASANHAAGYLSCERWAAEANAGAGLAGFEQLGLLVVDDLHRLYGQVDAQNALTDGLSRLHAAGGRSIITYTASPEALGGYDPQLLSRLHGGIALRLNAPNEKVLAGIARQFIGRKGLDVPGDVLEFAVHAAAGDVRRMTGILLEAAVTAKMRGDAISLELAQGMTTGRPGSS